MKSHGHFLTNQFKQSMVFYQHLNRNAEIIFLQSRPGCQQLPVMSTTYAKQVLQAEANAILAIREALDARFEQALDLLANCAGRIVTCGMGKAGIIAQKIAATMASTGSPAFPLHPADALHGDLGMIGKGDTALILSNSGESDEITRLLPCLRRVGAGIVAITSSDRSTLAVQADVSLIIGEINEACPLGLAPTATTTAMLALGDALALCLMQRKGFKVEDYAQLHPAGALGRKVLPVEDVMRKGEAVAMVTGRATVSETILAITKARAGAAAVVDDAGKLLGVFCDGDLRRGIETNPGILSCPVSEVMTANCTTALAGTRAGEVLGMMKEKRIAEVPVVDRSGRLLGMADMKSLLAAL